MQSCARREALARLMEVMDDIDRMGDPILKSNAIKKLDWADINVQTRFGVKTSPGAPACSGRSVRTILYWYWRPGGMQRGGMQRAGDWKCAGSKKDAMKYWGKWADGQGAPYPGDLYDPQTRQLPQGTFVEGELLPPPSDAEAWPMLHRLPTADSIADDDADDAEPEQSKESAAAQVQALLPPHPLIFCYNVLLWPSAQCCYT